ncbi:hypothetical protein U8P73_36760 (plasmid) [Rhizobium beringeri]|uniref:hypothetical protein n=1 Tax=Rhizobium beringeri TaxID=3019934 RepID=UPI002DDCF5FB|nr:hypothetical protein [Rhizobium beringeri]WSG93525.1 hypothetical protein U8P73_36760 [Rhizobium beringeri]
MQPLLNQHFIPALMLAAATLAPLGSSEAADGQITREQCKAIGEMMQSQIQTFKAMSDAHQLALNATTAPLTPIDANNPDGGLAEMKKLSDLTAIYTPALNSLDHTKVDAGACGVGG